MTQILRAGQIIHRLRDFVSQGETEKRLEDVDKMIEEAGTLALVGPDALGVETRYRFDESASLVFADRVQIQQVLVNLIRNSLEAMSQSQRRELVVAATRRARRYQKPSARIAFTPFRRRSYCASPSMASRQSFTGRFGARVATARCDRHPRRALRAGHCLHWGAGRQSHVGNQKLRFPDP